MNYSLFIMVVKEMVLMETKGQPRVAQRLLFYPPSLQIHVVYSLFLCLPIAK
jgi:hypothetical protein